MSQIVKRKKGRPSKADLASRMSLSSATPGNEIRRSLRPRNVRYTFDFDDYLDEDEEDEVDDERRREKKLKMVLKLNQSRARADPPLRSRGRPPSARGRHASDEEGEEEVEIEEEEEETEGGGEEEEEVAEEELEDECVKPPLKKRKINGQEDKDYAEEELVDDEEERRKEVETGSHSGPGTPSDPSSGTPVPDKKLLFLILDKLQKKDIYGVYAEPVDPEELPDYHEIIENPMDFGTVRKKLADASYSTLEEFEGDVFLICSNAMEYNTPDTVYYKQARTIQEMAKKKFEKIRGKIERAEKERKSEQKTKVSYPTKKEVKKPSSKKSMEPVGSDLSSGINVTTGTTRAPMQASGYEKHSYTDGHVEGNAPLVDYPDKAEELSSGKSLLGNFGRKLSAIEEDRRASYSVFNQSSVKSESVFSTFEGEIKHLVTVGLHAEHAYTRSLARFAATLGPVAWKVASQRIQQALPAGFKFGRGWVGEYEPLPTPALLIEQKNKEVFPVPKMSIDDPTEDKMACKASVPDKEKPVTGRVSETRSGPLQTSGKVVSEGKASFVPSPRTKPNSTNIQRNQQQFWTTVEHQNKIPQQVELNLPPSTNQNFSVLSPDKLVLDMPETRASRPSDSAIRNVNLLQSPYLNPTAKNGGFPGGLPNGKTTSSFSSKMTNLSSDTTADRMARETATQLPHEHDQGLTDPVQLMRSLTEKAKIQPQQNFSNHPQVSTPSFPSTRTDNASNATVAAARAWMSIGSGQFHSQVLQSRGTESPQSAGMQYQPERNGFPSSMQYQPERNGFPSAMQYQPERKGFPFEGFVPQQLNRPVMYPQPQLVTSVFPRFQVQSPWRGITPHVHVKQKQDNLPPDLNIGVQSPDSPAKQSSGLCVVDSQHPDLALQL